MNDVVARIDLLRKSKGFTKKALAKEVGVSQSTFNKWYYSDTMPSINNIQNICKALDISVEQFFSGMGNPSANEAEREFIDSWRMLTETEKTAVEKVIIAFKEAKGGAV